MSELNILIPKDFAVDDAAEFREKTNNLISQGEINFVLDFSNCTFIDSTGLGVLVGIYKKCTELNGSFKLHSINPQVMKLFNLTRLDKVFQISK
ncbi:MAG: anti-sigma B factor antagonist [Clostridium sp.]|jgi:anti-sigma B factor antagonist